MTQEALQPNVVSFNNLFLGGTERLKRLWLVVWNMAFLFHNIWVVILPIDELHHFSRLSFNHQPAGISIQHFKMLAGKRDLKINVRRVNVCVMGQPRFTTAE